MTRRLNLKDRKELIVKRLKPGMLCFRHKCVANSTPIHVFFFMSTLVGPIDNELSLKALSPFVL